MYLEYEHQIKLQCTSWLNIYIVLSILKEIAAGMYVANLEQSKIISENIEVQWNLSKMATLGQKY